MEDSFFEFNTSLNQGLELLDEPELDKEEEYDALNDETFGTDAFQGDWEEDHTRFAEVTENSRTYKNSFNSEKDDADFDLQESLTQFVLQSEEDDEDEEADSDAKLDSSKPANIFNKFPFNSIDGYSSPVWNTHSDEKSSNIYKKQQQQHQLQHQHQPQHQPQQPNFHQLHPPVPRLPVTHFLPPQLSRIPTVQELERHLIQKNKQNNFVNKSKENNQSIIQDKNYYPTLPNNLNDHYLNSNDKLSNLNIQQQKSLGKYSQIIGSNKFPPGFGPLQHGHLNQLHQQDVANLRNNQSMPMPLGQFFFPPHLLMLLPHHMLPHNPHPFPLSQNHRMMKPHLMRFMPAHPLVMQQHQHQQQHHQKQQTHHKMQNNQYSFKNEQASQNHHNTSHFHHPWFHNPNRRESDNYDEYAGFMNNRERQWLLNIQIIQLTTDNPFVDDYYYKVWSKKQEMKKKLKEETQNGLKKEKPFREAYFPNNRIPKNEINQRERRNSEREMAVVPSSKVYVPLQFENSLGKLQCGSIMTPRQMIDLDVVPERQMPTTQTSHRDSRKAKKILLELESLYLLTMNLEDLENNLIPEKIRLAANENSLSKPKLLEQIMNSYLNEDRFVNFMCVRKGKTLLLRVLLHLNNEDHSEQLTKLWCHLFKSFSVIIRRDQSDGILLQLYPYFKQWINTVDCTVLSIIASYLLTANVLSQAKKSSRAVSPNSGKSVLSYVLTTTFGVSAVSSILSRGESLYPVLEEKEKQDWTNFILNFIKHMTNSPNLESQMPTPLDPLPSNVVTVILNRSTGLHIQDYASAKRVLTAFNKDKCLS